MILEYGIQRKIGRRQWSKPPVIETLESAKARLESVKRAYPGEKYRLVVREVSPWCEAKTEVMC